MSSYFFTKKQKGFVILFAVVVSTIILTIAFGVSSIAVKEIAFGTSAKDANDAFYAADVGAECAMLNDRTPATSFAIPTGSGNVQCLGTSYTVTGSGTWTFAMSDIGPAGKNCAKVVVTKTGTPPAVTTLVDSKGYNATNATCTFPTTTNRVEREIKVTY